MLKKIVERCMVGFVLGVFFGDVLMLLIKACFVFFAPDAGIDFSRTLRTDLIFDSSCFLFFGLYGMITGGLTLIWSIEKWSLLKQTAVHFVLQYTLATACTFLPRIYTTTYKSFVLWTAIFVAIYIVIWLVIYIKIYLTISVLNKQLDLRVFQVSKN